MTVVQDGGGWYGNGAATEAWGLRGRTAGIQEEAAGMEAPMMEAIRMDAARIEEARMKEAWMTGVQDGGGRNGCNNNRIKYK